MEIISMWRRSEAESEYPASFPGYSAARGSCGGRSAFSPFSPGAFEAVTQGVVRRERAFPRPAGSPVEMGLDSSYLARQSLWLLLPCSESINFP